MRQSRYVVAVEGAAGQHMLYNVANGAFVELSDEARASWEALGAGAGAQADAAGDELARLGFATDLSADEELAFQRRLFDRARADTSELTLSFVPTYACNFRCPYCYEVGHNKIPGKMDARVMDAILEFVEFKRGLDGFGKLSVQWYGGDPSLALDVVEELTGRLVAWCEERGIAYDAMMITNANVIDEPAADVVARCRISRVFLTIDGPESLHNRRRVAANGTNSYERTIASARLLRARGVSLAANMNADKVNIAFYEELRERLLSEEGIELGMGKLNDYGGTYGSGQFCAPDFDLFEHEEFFRAQFDAFAARPHEVGELREMLRPITRFCTGQADNYFIVDVRGDVYKCDGWVGDASQVKFSLFDPRGSWKLHEVTFDATRDNACGECELLPVCQGSCYWERACSGMPCHPFKTTIGDYLRVYRDCLDVPAVAPGGVAVLAEPFSAAELGWDALGRSIGLTGALPVAQGGADGELSDLAAERMREVCGDAVALVLAFDVDPERGALAMQDGQPLVAHAVKQAYRAQVAMVYVLTDPAIAGDVAHAAHSVRRRKIDPFVEVLAAEQWALDDRTCELGGGELMGLPAALVEIALGLADDGMGGHGKVLVTTTNPAGATAERFYELCRELSAAGSSGVAATHAGGAERPPYAFATSYLAHFLDGLGSRG